jgi:hypothetical protein
LNPFTIVPDKCKLTYECVSVDRIDGDIAKDLIPCADFNFDGLFDNSPTDGEGYFIAPISKYTDGSYPPGEYLVTISGTTIRALTPLTATATFKLTLIDPCDPPVSITGPSPAFVD